VLTWPAVAGAISFRVYRTGLPGDPRNLWTLIGEIAATTYRDVGVAGGADVFYNVVVVGPSGEGGW